MPGGKHGIQVPDQQHVKAFRLRLVADEHAGAHLIAQIHLLGVPALALPELLHNACHGGNARNGLGAAVHVHQGFQLFNIVVKVHVHVLFRE